MVTNISIKFPAYKTMQVAKQFCYPTDITLSEARPFLKLEVLLEHTSERLCQGVTHII